MTIVNIILVVVVVWGKRNEPAYVVEVVKKLAEIKSVSLEEMNGQIFENAKRIFKI